MSATHSVNEVRKESMNRAPWGSRFYNVVHTVAVQTARYAGVGIVCSVAYFDPGNWAVDLQAGSQFGYRLLFVVLLAGLFAIVLQILASRLGCVTGLDLASHCRLLLHSRPKHTLWYRYCCLYPLYCLSEIAIISTDLAELLGSAIALCLLIPRLELWHGVLLTSFDVLLLLAMKDPLGGRPVKAFEILIGVMVVAVLLCMCIIVSRVDVAWGHVFLGYVPSQFIFRNGAVFSSVGILGATVMPHSLFLGSALAMQDRRGSKETEDTFADMEPKDVASVSEASSVTESDSVPESGTLGSLPKRWYQAFCDAFRPPPPSPTSIRAKQADRENSSLEFVKAHIYRGAIDLVVSLLGFALVINSLILILAGAVFFTGGGSDGPASLFDAYDLIVETVGQAAATLFAVALLFAGQSSSIIATVAGQVVSEGFLEWRVSPVVRRLFTRLIAVIPSMAVAVSVGKPGISMLLVISQVILSAVLPFITLPLIFLTSSRKVMSVKPEVSKTSSVDASPGELEMGTLAAIDFSNGKAVTVLTIVIWLIIVAANIFGIATVGNQ